MQVKFQVLVGPLVRWSELMSGLSSAAAPPNSVSTGVGRPLVLFLGACRDMSRGRQVGQNHQITDFCPHQPSARSRRRFSKASASRVRPVSTPYRPVITSAAMHITQQESHDISVLAGQGELVKLRKAVHSLAERESASPADILIACKDDFQQTAAHMAAKGGQVRMFSAPF